MIAQDGGSPPWMVVDRRAGDQIGALHEDDEEPEGDAPGKKRGRQDKNEKPAPKKKPRDQASSSSAAKLEELLKNIDPENASSDGNKGGDALGVAA